MHTGGVAHPILVENSMDEIPRLPDNWNNLPPYVEFHHKKQELYDAFRKEVDSESLCKIVDIWSAQQPEQAHLFANQNSSIPEKIKFLRICITTSALMLNELAQIRFGETPLSKPRTPISEGSNTQIHTNLISSSQKDNHSLPLFVKDPLDRKEREELMQDSHTFSDSKQAMKSCISLVLDKTTKYSGAVQKSPDALSQTQTLPGINLVENTNAAKKVQNSSKELQKKRRRTEPTVIQPNKFARSTINLVSDSTSESKADAVVVEIPKLPDNLTNLSPNQGPRPSRPRKAPVYQGNTQTWTNFVKKKSDSTSEGTVVVEIPRLPDNLTNLSPDHDRPGRPPRKAPIYEGNTQTWTNFVKKKSDSTSEGTVVWKSQDYPTT